MCDDYEKDELWPLPWDIQGADMLNVAIDWEPYTPDTDLPPGDYLVALKFEEGVDVRILTVNACKQWCGNGWYPVSPNVYKAIRYWYRAPMYPVELDPHPVRDDDG